MWIALAVIGALWFVGAVVVPDKTAPSKSSTSAAATAQVGSAAQPPSR